MSSSPVAALYTAEDSVYKELLGADMCWDSERDARRYPGPHPIVAHPPCAQWCAMKHLAHKIPEQKELALIAIDQVRKWGGVLEHPAYSSLWKESDLPFAGGLPDKFGGRTIAVRQYDWGHMARKLTWLYCVRCEIPPMPPPRPGEPGKLWYGSAGGKTWEERAQLARNDVTPLPPGVSRGKVRLASPRAFAEFLIAIARSAIKKS